MSKTLFKTCLLSLAVITLAACGQKEETTTTEAPTTVAETTVAETTVAETTVAETETTGSEEVSEETSELAEDESSEAVSEEVTSDESTEASSEEATTTADETTAAEATTAEETTVEETTAEATTTEATAAAPAVAPAGSEEAEAESEEASDESEESSSGETGANGDETQLAPIPERSAQIVMEDDKAFDKLLEDSKSKAQIIYVGFEECPFCKEFVSKLNAAAEKAQVKFHYYNTDYRGQDANFDKVIGEFLQISTVPHAFLIKDGKVVEKLTSDAKDEDFDAFVKKATEN